MYFNSYLWVIFSVASAASLLYSAVKWFLPHSFFIIIINIAYLKDSDFAHLKDSAHQTNCNITQR